MGVEALELFANQSEQKHAPSSKSLRLLVNEAKFQRPAHLIKPPGMITLLDLEDERDAILAQIDSIGRKTGKEDKIIFAEFIHKDL